MKNVCRPQQPQDGQKTYGQIFIGFGSTKIENCDTILAKLVVVVHMKINIIIVKLDLVPFVTKNLPLECKQPKSMNTEKKIASISIHISKRI